MTTPITPGGGPQAGKPSQTALRVAILRAVHALLDEPAVLHDPIALPILGPDMAAALRDDPFQHNDPLSRGLRAALVVRSRVVEDELARAVAAGGRQYVVLGAGLDTFAYRNPHTASGLHVYEVDHPATQGWKRQALAAAGIPLPTDLTFVPVDFERETLAHALAAAGFRPDQPACFSWLGVSMYLSEAAIMAVLGYVATLPPGSSITFDFRVPPALLNPVERVIAEMMAQRVAALGEPWISAFDPAALRDQVRSLGFSMVETYGPDVLNPRYLHRRKDGLHTNGRILHART